MSTRVYLSKYTCQPTHEEETPVCLRIQLSRATVKELHSRLQHAYQRDDVRLVRRITVLLDLAGAPGARGGAQGQMGPQLLLSLSLAAGLSAAGYGQPGLSP